MVIISNYRGINKKPLLRDNDISEILDLEDYKLLKPTLETLTENNSKLSFRDFRAT